MQLEPVEAAASVPWGSLDDPDSPPDPVVAESAQEFPRSGNVVLRAGQIEPFMTIIGVI